MHRSSCRTILRLSFALLPFSFLTAQNTYYISPRGDDTHDGRTPGSAWRTLAKCGAQQYQPGDQVLLERGGRWQERLPLSASGAAGSPILYSAYGAQGDDPVIDLGGALPGWSTAGNWHSEGSNVWSYTATDFGDDGPGRLWLDGKEQRISGSWTISLDPKATPTTPASTTGPARAGAPAFPTTPAAATWYDNATGNHALYLYATANPASAYRSIEVSSLLPANSWSGKSYVSFRHLQFRRGKDCVALGNCDYFSFDSCRIGWGTPGFILWVQSGSDHGLITHTRFNRDDSVQHTWEYSASAKVNTGRSDGLAIQCGSFWEVAYDTFTTCGHAGVSVNGRSDESGPTASGHTESKYNKIHNCVFTGGGDYSRAWGCVAYPTSEAASLCYGNEFYRNLVDGCRTQPTINGGETKCYYNVFANQGWIPYNQPEDAWRSHTLMIGDFDNGSYACVHPQVFNNTFLNCSVAGLLVSDGPMHASIKNNIFYNCGNRGNPFEPYTAIAFWPGATTDTIENNIIYSSSSSATITWQSYIWNTGQTRLTVSQFNAQTGSQAGTNQQTPTHTAWQVSNVISGNLAVNPQLQGDFRISLSSPAKDAGLPVGADRRFLRHSPPPAPGPISGPASCRLMLPRPGSPQTGDLCPVSLSYGRTIRIPLTPPQTFPSPCQQRERSGSRSMM